MNTTLEALLHDALAQSEHFHGGLAAPAVRSTIARKRVVRRAAVSSVATVGALGIGAGAYAVSTGFAPTATPAGGSLASASVSSSPSPTTGTSGGNGPMISQNAPEDPTSLSSRRADFCEQLPLVVAWLEAQGITDPSWGISYSEPDMAPMFGCLVYDEPPAGLQGALTINFTFPDSTGGDVAKGNCVDDNGTMTFETSASAELPDARKRTGIACLDGAVIKVDETLPSDTAVALTDAQLKVPAEASVAMAGQARSLTP